VSAHDFKVGERVEHDADGVGTVDQVDGSGVLVRFDSGYLCWHAYPFITRYVDGLKSGDCFEPGDRVTVDGNVVGTVRAAGLVSLHIRLDNGTIAWVDHDRVKRFILNECTDAAVWAREFCRQNKAIPIDEATMIGWFANAIMAGHDSVVRSVTDPENQPTQWGTTLVSKEPQPPKLSDFPAAVCREFKRRVAEVQYSQGKYSGQPHNFVMQQIAEIVATEAEKEARQREKAAEWARLDKEEEATKPVAVEPKWKKGDRVRSIANSNITGVVESVSEPLWVRVRMDLTHENHIGGRFEDFHPDHLEPDASKLWPTTKAEVADALDPKEAIRSRIAGELYGPGGLSRKAVMRAFEALLEHMTERAK